MAARYAIYFVPAPESPLYRFGAGVLGYDGYTGCNIPPIAGADSLGWPAVVAEPRVYGFHATLKAPFRLAEGTREAELLKAAYDFAASQSGVVGGPLALKAIGAFLALVPAGSCAGIDQLAQACVERFDRFRAPMTYDERARRMRAPLSASQIAYLDRWGYPYVCEEFRFHMTLTGPLDLSNRDTVQRFLDDKFLKVPAAQNLSIDRIALARQTESGVPFRVIESFTLR